MTSTTAKPSTSTTIRTTTTVRPTTTAYDDETEDYHAFAYDYATTNHDCDCLLRAVVCLVDNETVHGQLRRLFKCDQNENLRHIRHMPMQRFYYADRALCDRAMPVSEKKLLHPVRRK
ncbi:hypothetical protein AAVH_33104, partial [Aphelenchoides avenae]